MISWNGIKEMRHNQFLISNMRNKINAFSVSVSWRANRED